MRTLADTVYSESQFDELCELPKSGSSLENPYVFDAVARDLKAMAERGLLEIVGEGAVSTGQDVLIDHLTFKRMA